MLMLLCQWLLLGMRFADYNTSTRMVNNKKDVMWKIRPLLEITSDILDNLYPVPMQRQSLDEGMTPIKCRRAPCLRTMIKKPIKRGSDVNCC